MQFLKRLKPMVSPVQNSAANTIYVDSDTEEVKVGTGASGTSERVLLSSIPTSTEDFSPSSEYYLPFGETVISTKDPVSSDTAPLLVLSEVSEGTGAVPLYSIAVLTDDATGAQGSYFETMNDSADVGSMAAISAAVSAAATSTATDHAIQFSAAGNYSDGGTITNIYGIKIEDQVADVGMYAVHTSQTADTDSYAMFNEGDAKSYFGGDVGIGTEDPASRLDIADGAITFSEMTAPAAPAANGCVLYVEDNGSGKTRLMALFATGAAIPVATQL